MPVEKAIELIDHGDHKSFKKYCKAPIKVLDRVMHHWLSRELVDHYYGSVLDEKKQHFDEHKVCFGFFCILCL